MPTYKVQAVNPNPKQWTSRRGDAMLSYRVTLQNAEGRIAEGVELTQKASTAAPTVGQTVGGTVENGQYGMKFKKEFRGPGGGGGGGGYRPRDPRENAAIIRQHSQSAAVAVIAAKAAAGLATPDDFTPANLRKLIDFFDTDVDTTVENKLGPRPVTNGAAA